MTLRMGSRELNEKYLVPALSRQWTSERKIFWVFFFFWYMKFLNPYKNQNPNDNSLTPLRSAMARGVSTNSFQTEVPRWLG